MNNAFLKSLIVAAVMASASIAFTQEKGPEPGPGQQGPGRQGGQRGQQGGQGQQRPGMGQRGGMQQMGFTNPLAGSGFQFLNRADVRSDLKITTEQATALDALREKNNQAMRTQMEAVRASGNMDMQALQAAREKADAALIPEINKILEDGQESRFKEIRIQIAGLRAVLSPEIQTALGMEGQQKTKINVLARNATAEQQALMQQVRNQQIAREDVQAKNQAITEKFNKDLAAAVTEEQKAALKAMGGAEFKQQQGQGGEGRPGGRPGGGRPGAGGAQPQ
ncbi:MAG: hypothetical protein JNK63_05650 [Chthonomonas sp.]|nr:hypothetical protein [Chthonomonas sp.]